MLSRNQIILFLLTIIPRLFVAGESIVIDWNLIEESPPNVSIGTLYDKMPIYMGKDVTFMTKSDLFQVDSKTGEVRATKAIDLEGLCPDYQKCCGVKICTLEANVLVMKDDIVSANFLLRIRVIDVNDNRPVFATKSQTVSVSENARVGSFIGLTAAIDNDFDSINRIEKYRLSETSGKFSIDQSSLPNIRLVVQRPLDREEMSEYPATIEACDKGACERQGLIIKILDVNDNKPRFISRNYPKTLREDTQIGSYVMDLKATDLDAGENGKVIYSFTGNIDKNLAETFEVERDTGRIRLKKALAANIRREYIFSVKACDAVDVSCSGDENSTTKVVINIEDINNCAPSIDIIPNKSNVISSGDDIVIIENSQPSQLATIMAKDDDLDANGRVDCDLDETAKKNGFSLNNKVAGIFALRTDSIYDHEKQARISVLLTCSDNGHPTPLSTKRIIKIKIQDVNEFLPQFSQNKYIGHVKENSQEDTKVLTVSATDQDGESVIRYSIVNTTRASYSYSSDRRDDFDMEFFKIDPKIGLITTTNIPIDREMVNKIELIVRVTDATTEPINYVLTTVTINIDDVNDNAPNFIRPVQLNHYQPGSSSIDISQLARIKEKESDEYFYIKENLPPNSPVIGNIIAEDRDQGVNGEIEYIINATWGLKMQSRFPDSGAYPQLLDQPVFRLTKDYSLETIQTLDREDIPIYELEIIARDRGQPQLSTMAKLIVYVFDENDNYPNWRFPSKQDRNFNISSGAVVGDLVLRLQAYDADHLGSGNLDYIILDAKGEPMAPMTRSEGLPEIYDTPEDASNSRGSEERAGYRFGALYLNGSTGEIKVAQALTVGTLNLHLRARDKGEPAKHTDTWLNIHIYQDPDSAFAFLSWGSLNITIVLVMISVTALISLLLIGAIVCVQKRPRTHDHNFPGDGYNINHPNDLHCNGGYLDKGIFTNGYNWTTPNAIGNDYCYNGGLAGTPLLDENGQLIMGYGNNQNAGTISPTGMASDTTSMIFVPNHPYASKSQGSVTNYDNDYAHQQTMPFQSFGTLSRNQARFHKVNGHIDGCLDGESGDSGKGPSEEGNQAHGPMIDHSTRNIYSTSFRGSQNHLPHPIRNVLNGYNENDMSQVTPLIGPGPIMSSTMYDQHSYSTRDQDTFGQSFRTTTPKPQFIYNPNSPGLPLPPPRSPRVGSSMTIRRANNNQPHIGDCVNYETGSLPRNSSRRSSLSRANSKPLQSTNPNDLPSQAPLKLDLRQEARMINQSRMSLENQGLPPTGKSNQNSNNSNGSGEYEGQVNFNETNPE